MKTKIEIKSVFGEVLFSYEKENNTIKETVEEAVSRGANLRGANLSSAFLGEFGFINGVEDILMVGPIGSRNGYTTIYHTNKGLFVRCGCFHGTIDKFADKVQETHGGNKHGKSYMALIDFAKLKYNENN